jgi:hypothetical protein
MALMVQDAVLESKPVAAPMLTGLQGLCQTGSIIRMYPIQPAEISQLALQTQQLQTGRVPPQTLPGRPGPDPGLQHRHGLCHQRHLKGVVTSTPGVSYLSITRLETGSEYLSKQSHSISNIGAGAEQPRQHRWPRTSPPVVRHQGLPASSYEVEPDVTPPCPDSLPSGPASSPARSGSWCAVATPC